MPRSVAKNRGCGWNQPDCSALFGTRHYVGYAELGIIHSLGPCGDRYAFSTRAAAPLSSSMGLISPDRRLLRSGSPPA